jgi:DNA polymerase-3 subunit beta
MEVNGHEFAAAADRVATISTEKSRAVKLSLTPGHLVLSANSPEAGSATEELEVKYDGALLDIGFNARYLLDIMQQIEGEGARFTLADATAPAIIQDVADASALYVLMPMRV